MKSIKEQLLQNGGVAEVTLHMGSKFAWEIFAPKAGDIRTTECGIKVCVAKSTYYEDSQIGIVKLKAI